LELKLIFDGPTVFAHMLRDELAERGIAAVVRAPGAYSGIMADQVQPPFSEVLVSDEDLVRRAGQVEECLALVSPVGEVEAEEAGDGGST
jgi:hypothetical protein